MDLEGDGAQGRNRTTDTAIFSRMLYQLSYLGAGRIWRGPNGGLIGAEAPLVQSADCAVRTRRMACGGALWVSERRSQKP
jgi:hypothetical protein